MNRQDSISCVNSVFEQPWWLDAVSPGRWDEVLVKEGEEVVARLPYCFDRETDGRRIVMPKLTQTLGIWIKKEKCHGNKHLSNQKAAIECILDGLPRSRSMGISIDSTNQYFLPFIWKGCQVVPRVSYRIDLSQGLDCIYDNFDRTVKKNIKSASKKTEICREVSTGVLMDIMKRTFEAQGRRYPIPGETVERVVEAAERHGAGRMYTARDAEGNVHASSYFVFDQNRCYYLISGTDVRYRSSGAQTLILWEAIKDSVNTSRSFDFEGSMVEGIESFFRRFGGEPVTYYEIRRQSIAGEIGYILKPYVKRALGYKS